MGITTSDVLLLAARYGSKKVEEQSDLSAPFAAKEMTTIKQEGQTGYVTIKTGGLSSTQFLADGAALPTGSNILPLQMTYIPRHLVTRLTLPRGGLELCKDVKDGVALVMEELDTAANDVARQKGRAVFTSQITLATECTAQIVGPPGSITVTDPLGYRIGATVTLGEAGVPGNRQTMVVSSVDFVTGVVTFTTAITLAGPPADAAIIAFLGNAESNSPESLDNVSSATADVYGKSASDAGFEEWKGTQIASGGTISTGALREIHDQIRIRRGQEIDVVVTNPIQMTNYLDLFTTNERFQRGDVLDNYALMATFDGKKFAVDPNCPRSKAYLVNKKDVLIHEFRSFGPVVDGDKRSSGMGAAIVSQNTFSWDVQMHESLNLRVLHRAGCGALTGLT